MKLIKAYQTQNRVWGSAGQFSNLISISGYFGIQFSK